MESNERGFIGKTDLGLLDSFEFSSAAFGVFWEARSFVTLVDNYIANSTISLVLENTDSWRLLRPQLHFLRIPFVEVCADHGELQIFAVLVLMQVDLEAWHFVAIFFVLDTCDRFEAHTGLVHGHQGWQIAQKFGLFAVGTMHVRQVEALALQLCHGTCPKGRCSNQCWSKWCKHCFLFSFFVSSIWRFSVKFIFIEISGKTSA